MALADWDQRLLGPGRALEMAGDWPVYATYELSELSQFDAQPDQWQINLRCRKCDQSCGLLATGDLSYQTTIGDLLSGVLRHLVTAHDLSLSGAPKGRTSPDVGGPLVISPSEEHARFIDAITEDQDG